MKITAFIFLILSPITLLSKGGEKMVTFERSYRSSWDGTHAMIEYRVSEEKLESLPKYNPIEDEVPLTIDEAVRIAWNSKSPREEYSIASVKLTNTNRYIEWRSPIWYYSVETFHKHGPTGEVVYILLDGTIVEPTETELSEEEYRERVVSPTFQ